MPARPGDSVAFSTVRSTQPSAAQRRQTVQLALGVTTLVLFLAGLFMHVLWLAAFPMLLVTLGYMSLAHQAARRDEERQAQLKRERLRTQRRRAETAVSEPALRAVPSPGAERAHPHQAPRGGRPNGSGPSRRPAQAPARDRHAETDPVGRRRMAAGN